MVLFAYLPTSITLEILFMRWTTAVAATAISAAVIAGAAATMVGNTTYVDRVNADIARADKMYDLRTQCIDEFKGLLSDPAYVNLLEKREQYTLKLIGDRNYDQVSGIEFLKGQVDHTYPILEDIDKICNF